MVQDAGPGPWINRGCRVQGPFWQNSPDQTVMGAPCQPLLKKPHHSLTTSGPADTRGLIPRKRLDCLLKALVPKPNAT